MSRRIRARIAEIFVIFPPQQNVNRTVPCTSRKPRPGEINGVDYTFLSIEQFRALEAKGELLESGEYGISALLAD